ncbi:uncharacterized protein MONOS_15389 [Monocercomonoides exilis]|uniref:uncharacterized protein n=1 Tax=Monocercomonoides exilis TaxID=2049356 RepID=UPI00355AC9EB|nr:hypothetical protein MONOS_15389 [Monocercomonoides exilis]|eukprot:MONOS_15389.1-p1 / transcript=MONOS_15389.1 / gene=MONOS_15389 / organism=Monocercomonoides_exilis_PA203 / gene_product=unspecified product / transcript_product=unspecified product / location=Mono_scaffold01216:1694-2609(-) / protein_length=189 / sequence_SO=supercontig / SO=protein_coding / is_pseudo=false
MDNIKRRLQIVVVKAVGIAAGVAIAAVEACGDEVGGRSDEADGCSMKDRGESGDGAESDIEAYELTGGAAAGEGQDHLDTTEEDSGAEREAQCRCEAGEAGEAGEGEEVLGTARRSGERGWQVETSWSVVIIATPSLLSSAGGGEVQSLALLILKLGLREKSQEKIAASFECDSTVMLEPDPTGKGML